MVQTRAVRCEKRQDERSSAELNSPVSSYFQQIKDSRGQLMQSCAPKSFTASHGNIRLGSRAALMTTDIAGADE